MSAVILFNGLFIAQALVFSICFPRYFFRQMEKVLANHPQELYPSLYVVPGFFYHRMHTNYLHTSYLMFVAGMVALVAFNLSTITINSKIAQALPWFFFMLQMLPVVILKSVEKSFRNKILSNTQTLSTTADCYDSKKHYFDVVPAKMLWATLAGLAGYILLELLYYWSTQQGNMWMRMVTVLVVHLFFTLNSYTALKGFNSGFASELYPTRKYHQFRMKVTLRSQLFISMSISVLLIVNILTTQFNLQHFKPCVMSIYCQCVGAVLSLILIKQLTKYATTLSHYKKET